MNFGLEDLKNNTILGTPASELSSLADEFKKSMNPNGIESTKVEKEQ